MPVWVCMIGTLVLNYVRHRTGRSTLCSSARTRVGPRAFVLGWVTLSAWLLPHYVRPLLRAVEEAIEEVES